MVMLGAIITVEYVIVFYRYIKFQISNSNDVEFSVEPCSSNSLDSTRFESLVCTFVSEGFERVSWLADRPSFTRMMEVITPKGLGVWYPDNVNFRIM